MACQEARLGIEAQAQVSSAMKEVGIKCAHSGPQEPKVQDGGQAVDLERARGRNGGLQ